MHLVPATAEQRRRHLFLLLRKPPFLAILVFVALLPVLLDRVPALFIPSPPLDPILVAAGFGAVLCLLLVMVLVSEAAAVVRRLRGREEGSLIFGEDGIREVRGARARERPWSWVVEASEDEGFLILWCEEPARTLRLSRSERRHVFVDSRLPGVDRLVQLLNAHRPGLLRRSPPEPHGA
jgi:hypothetical protein